MSLVSRRASAPLPSTESTDPTVRKAAVTEARKELGRRVVDLRRALDAFRPADYSSPEIAHTAQEQLKRDLDAAAGRENVAAEMEAALAKEIEAAQVEKAIADVGPAAAEADAALAAFASLALETGGKLAEALALARVTAGARDALRAELREAGKAPTCDARLSLAADWTSLLDKRPGAVGALATAANVVRWVEQAPQREAEEREFQRRRQIERERAERQAAADGTLGPKAQADALAAQRRDLVSFYGEPATRALRAGAAGTAAELALDIASRSVGVR